jgi:hypothetical protein
VRCLRTGKARVCGHSPRSPAWHLPSSAAGRRDAVQPRSETNQDEVMAAEVISRNEC